MMLSTLLLMFMFSIKTENMERIESCDCYFSSTRFDEHEHESLTRAGSIDKLSFMYTEMIRRVYPSY